MFWHVCVRMKERQSFEWSRVSQVNGTRKTFHKCQAKASFSFKIHHSCTHQQTSVVEESWLEKTSLGTRPLITHNANVIFKNRTSKKSDFDFFSSFWCLSSWKNGYLWLKGVDGHLLVFYQFTLWSLWKALESRCFMHARDSTWPSNWMIINFASPFFLYCSTFLTRKSQINELMNR